MKIGRVVGNLVSTHCLPAYEKRKLMLVQPLSPQGEPEGRVTMAIDYVSAGVGDTVIFSAAPGLASTVFGIERAPINELIMGIVDQVTIEDSGKTKKVPS